MPNISSSITNGTTANYFMKFHYLRSDTLSGTLEKVASFDRP